MFPSLVGMVILARYVFASARFCKAFLAINPSADGLSLSFGKGAFGSNGTGASWGIGSLKVVLIGRLLTGGRQPKPMVASAMTQIRSETCFISAIIA